MRASERASAGEVNDPSRAATFSESVTRTGGRNVDTVCSPWNTRVGISKSAGQPTRRDRTLPACVGYGVRRVQNSETSRRKGETVAHTRQAHGP